MHGIFISFTHTTAGVTCCGLGTQHATHREHGLHEPPEMAWCIRHHILLKVTTKLCTDQNDRISNTYFKLHPRINTAPERAISLFVSPCRMSASQIFPKARALCNHATFALLWNTYLLCTPAWWLWSAHWFWCTESQSECALLFQLPEVVQSSHSVSWQHKVKFAHA